MTACECLANTASHFNVVNCYSSQYFNKQIDVQQFSVVSPMDLPATFSWDFALITENK